MLSDVSMVGTAIFNIRTGSIEIMCVRVIVGCKQKKKKQKTYTQTHEFYIKSNSVKFFPALENSNDSFNMFDCHRFSRFFLRMHYFFVQFLFSSQFAFRLCLTFSTKLIKLFHKRTQHRLKVAIYLLHSAVGPEKSMPTIANLITHR